MTVATRNSFAIIDTRTIDMDWVVPDCGICGTAVARTTYEFTGMVAQKDTDGRHVLSQVCDPCLYEYAESTAVMLHNARVLEDRARYEASLPDFELPPCPECGGDVEETGAVGSHPEFGRCTSCNVGLHTMEHKNVAAGWEPGGLRWANGLCDAEEPELPR